MVELHVLVLMEVMSLRSHMNDIMDRAKNNIMMTSLTSHMHGITDRTKNDIIMMSLTSHVHDIINVT